MRQTVLGPVVQESAKAVSATFSTGTLDVSGLNNITAHYIWSAGSTPSGTVKVEGSLDGLTWADLITAVAVSGTSGNAILHVSNKVVKYARVTYTQTSGSHTAKVVFFGNGI